MAERMTTAEALKVLDEAGGGKLAPPGYYAALAVIQGQAERWAWLDVVPRKAHPDDERPWAAEYVRASVQIESLEAQAERLIEALEKIAKQPGYAARKVAIARAALDAL